MKKNAPQHPGKYIKNFVLPDISVKEAANLLQIGRPALSNLLNGKAALSAEMAHRLAKAFGADGEKLMEMQILYDAYQFKKDAGSIAVHGYVPSFLGIRALQIETWGATIEARSRLSVLLRRLVNATGNDLSHVDFPGYDKSEKKGWDGVVEAGSATPWIPLGRSGWEFGCDKKPEKKAENDYVSRTSSVPVVERRNTTFVFVTPHQWNGKKAWVKAKEELGEWKSVRVLDSSDLEQWLEQSLTTQSWFLEELKESQREIETLGHFWTDWSEVCDPVLSTELFSDSIARHREKILAWLEVKPDKTLAVAADSRGEALAFLFAFFASDESLTKYQDKVALLHSSAVLEKVATSTIPLVGIVADNMVQKTIGRIFRKHHTIVIVPKNSVSYTPDIVLDQVGHSSFKKALEAMGLNQDESERLTKESGYSPTILRRRLAVAEAVRTPEYQRDRLALQYITALAFLGAWHTKSSGDRDVVCFMADCDISEVDQRISYLLQFEESPVWSANDYRGVTSKIEVLFALKNIIQDADVKRFFIAAEIVLSEKDPAIELPEENRWAANLFGKSRNHSSALRHHICETLVLLSLYGNTLFKERLGIDVKMLVDELIRRLMSSLDFEKVLSLNNDLTYYAEASPHVFLTVIEADLKTDKPVFVELMKPVKSSFFGTGVNRTELLWALEILAWNIEYLPRVCYILAELSREPIDDNYANNPLNTLYAIFCSWLPQTSGSLEERKLALTGVLKRFPDIGWKICVHQFKLNQSGHYGHRPRWRTDASGAGGPSSGHNRIDFVMAAFENALSYPLHDRTTLGDLVKYSPNFAIELQIRIWNLIKEKTQTKLTDESKAYLREQFRIFVLPSERIKNQPEKLTLAYEVYRLLEPEDSVLKHQWLFQAHWLHGSIEGIDDDRHNFNRRDEVTQELRVKAMQHIWRLGMEQVDCLIDNVGAPRLVGWMLTKSDYSGLVPRDLVMHQLKQPLQPQKRDEFLRGFFDGIADELRLAILDDLISVLDDEQVLRVFLQCPSDRVTWNALQQTKGKLEELYWREIQPYVYYKNVGDINVLAEILLKAGRPVAAFNAVHVFHDKVDVVLLKNILGQIPVTSQLPNDKFEFASHDIDIALDTLEESGLLSEVEMADLEFLYIRVLSHSKHGIPNLQRQLASSAALFVQVLAMTYRRSDDGEDPPEWGLPDMESRKVTFGNTYALLEAMKHVPGTTSEGKVNEETLRSWIYEVRNLCALHAREEVGDVAIGRVLSAATTGEDGIWPCVEVRKIVEEISSPKISEGIYVGIRHSKGAIWGPTGAEERRISEDYKIWAAKTAYDFPFVSQMLRNISESFSRQAEWIQLRDTDNDRLRP